MICAVIATRNRAERLEALLRSLAAQEGPPVEAIVVDDGSIDSTPELLDRGIDGLVLRALRHARARGPAAARNAGWNAAHCRLVRFWTTTWWRIPDGRGHCWPPIPVTPAR